MPLTFAHPAAVLPIARQLPLSALVVGSMAPDYVYFLRLSPNGGFGHTLPGLFLFCLPVGLAVLLMFHGLIKRPLLSLCPDAMRQRLGPVAGRFRMASASDAARVAAAVLLGAATHVVWDAFTHAGGWGVALVPALQRLVRLGSVGVPAFKVAQHGSTLMGITVMSVYAARWWRTTPVGEASAGLPARARSRRLAVLVGVPVALGLAFSVAVAVGSADPVRTFAGRLVVTTTTAAFVGAAGYGAWAARARIEPEG